MKILFYRYGSICEEDVLDCFIESGHEVVQITNEITDKSVTFAQSAQLVSDALNERGADCVFSINFYPAISDVCNIYHIRYICWVVDSPVLELFSKSITNKWNRVFLFDRAQFNEISPLNPECVFHYPLAVNVKSKQEVIKNSIESGKVICGADSRGNSTRDISAYMHDVSLVGSLYTEKSPFDKLSNNAPEYLKGYLEGIIEAQYQVYGYYFVNEIIPDEIVAEFKKYMPGFYEYPLESFLTDKDTVAQYYIGNKITAVERCRMVEAVAKKMPLDIYTGSDLSSFYNLIADGQIGGSRQLDRKPGIYNHGFCKTLTEMPIVFNQSKINLNPTSKAIRSGVPLRIFDVMACEGFVLSNYQIELAELFVPGEDFVFYESVDSIPDICAYYMEHENERKEIAHNAYVKVRDNYSYMLRLNGLLLKAFEV